jgi:hypothetical protein
MPLAGFEPATPATKRPQTYALDRATTEVGLSQIKNQQMSVDHLLINSELKAHFGTVWLLSVWFWKQTHFHTTFDFGVVF